MSLLFGLLTVISVGLSAPRAARRLSADTTTTLVGRILDVIDSAGVSGANIRVIGTDLTARTDGRGQFRIAGIPVGSRRLEVRAFRYSPDTESVLLTARDSVHVDIYLRRLPQLLSEMVVHGRAMRVPRGFEAVYMRGARGWGTFITAEQIDSIAPKDIKTMFEGIKGVFVSQRGVYFNRCYGNQLFGGEYGEVWIDGVRATKFQSDRQLMNELIEDIPPSEVQAIEVYTSSVDIPAEFTSGGSPCAVIAIWCKR